MVLFDINKFSLTFIPTKHSLMLILYKKIDFFILRIFIQMLDLTLIFLDLEI